MNFPQVIPILYKLIEMFPNILRREGDMDAARKREVNAYRDI